MSLILDALNRSRESVESVPTLATHHPVDPVSSGAGRWTPWIALALVLALLLIAWLVWDRFGSEPASASREESSVAELTQNIGSAAVAVTTELKARAEASKAQQTPQQEPVQPRWSDSGQSSGPAPAQPPVARPVPAQAPPKPAVMPVKPAVRTEAAAVPENAEVARLYRDRTVPEPAVETGPGRERPAEAAATSDPLPVKTVEQPINIEDVLKHAQDEVENAGLVDHPAPFLTSLSQQAKNEIPTIYYREHDYSSDPSRSTVTLNGKTVKVGGSPGSGMKVEEILPDSVVLDYRGTQFRLRALNSWVNL